MARRPRGDRNPSLKHILRLIDEQERVQLTPSPIDFGAEKLDPRFAYQGSPGRNPFQAPMQADPMAAQAQDQPNGLPDWLNQAMEKMRAMKAQGFQSDGDLARQQFQAQGGVRRSPLWG